MTLDLHIVLEHTHKLQRATSVAELLEISRGIVSDVSGYDNIWICAFESEPLPAYRLLHFTGNSTVNWADATIYVIGQDAMLQEILSGGKPVVVEDARTDPRTNKEIVAALGNRTIINIPLLLGQQTLGALGFGTFDPDEPRCPSEEAIEYLCIIGTHLAAALERVRLIEEHKLVEQERTQLKLRLQTMQRLDSLATLAGAVAHDFNNMLSVISHALEFALEDLHDPEALVADLNDAKLALQQATQLTGRLLATGRPKPSTLRPLSVCALLRSQLTLIRRLIPQHIALELSCSDELPIVMADDAQLEQVLTNLCINARDAMQHQGRALNICVSLQHLDAAAVAKLPWGAPGDFAKISIQDQGCGIAPEHLERVFDPFFTTKPHGAGTGLGLSVSAGIIKQHGGFMACESILGQGTTISIYLPVAAPSPPSP